MRELKPRKTQRFITVEIGFNSLSVMCLIRSGASKVPLDRVPALARALGADPMLRLRLAFEQAGSETTRLATEEIFETVFSRNEVTWLKELRDASGPTDPGLTNRARSPIRGKFRK